MAAKNESNEIRITRVYDAPVKAVWEAWTDPRQLAHWWGPRGYTITTHSHDLRAGGFWSYTMHGPDGVDYATKTLYRAVEPRAKLVYDHGGNDDRPAVFRVTVTFSEFNGKTTMDMRMTLPTPEALEKTRAIIRKAGGNTTWDRLAEYLTKESAGKEQFVINRTFDAPLEVLFAMWTDPAHFSRWLPPTGFTMEFIRADIRQGGSTFFVMKGAENVKMYGRANYLAIEKPHRLVYTQQFCDEKEQVSRHPLAPTWPETMLTTVTLSEEGPGRTRVTVAWETHGAVTAEEVATFVKSKGGMTQGWTGSFDKLESMLANG